jgi:hypothetical protein
MEANNPSVNAQARISRSSAKLLIAEEFQA